jgi:2-C-methyl-D-erythritol 4-phosphate cytidylyltransferase
MIPAFDVLIPAAGSGSRFTASLQDSVARGAGEGGAAGAAEGEDKLLLDIAGRSVLQRSVAAFAARADAGTLLIITAPARFAAYRAHLESAFDLPPGKIDFVAGGRERWESVLSGLRALQSLGSRCPFVAIHDAARPLVPARVIDEAFATTLQRGAALPCVPEPATLKRRGADGCVEQTVDRRQLFQAQTPQCFDRARLTAGYEQLLAQGRLADVTDDAQVFERMNWAVPITAGSPVNLKITTREDVLLARAMV